MDSFSVSGHIVDVLNRTIYDGTVVIEGNRISEIRKEEVPSYAPYIMPGFTDSHIHIESTLLTPEHYAALAVSKGVIAVVSDPHEIANVTGLDGVNFMIENGKKVHFHFYFGASPCVPCTGFETAGARLDSKDIETLLKRDEIYGVAEFMNAFGVINGDKECMAKLNAARKAGKPVDGHAPGLTGNALARYAAHGISSDHECANLEEGKERIANGMLVQIRQGSAAEDYDTLAPLLADNPGKVMFCSDDKYPNELLEGYLDQMVAQSVEKGYPMWNVLEAACVTPVQHYKLKHGLLRKGDNADFILVDNLRDFNVLESWIDGAKVFAGGKVVEKNFIRDTAPTTAFPNKFAAEKIKVDDLKVPCTGGRLKVITARDLSLRTGVEFVTPKVEDGCVVSDVENDVLKIVVYNRYEKAKPQVAFIKGFQLKCGAMGSTISHDSHNIVAIGATDQDIVNVINILIEYKGGLLIADGMSVSGLALPVAGLMSPLDGEVVAKKYAALRLMAQSQGCPFNAPFMTMAFMSLPVIPELKITDKGLFDVNKFAFTDLME